MRRSSDVRLGETPKLQSLTARRFTGWFTEGFETHALEELS